MMETFYGLGKLYCVAIFRRLISRLTLGKNVVVLLTLTRMLALYNIFVRFFLRTHLMNAAANARGHIET